MAEAEKLPRYHSPFDNRYGGDRMAALWAPEVRVGRRRDIWIAEAEVQALVGLVAPEEVQDLKDHRDEIDYPEIHSREFDVKNPKYTGHDVLAELSQYADVAPIGARVLHRANTSEDLLSNEEVMCIKVSLSFVGERLCSTLAGFAGQIEKYKDLVCLGYTHDQPAEPTTLGYRFASYAQDHLIALDSVRYVNSRLRTKGIKGAVGTSAPFVQLLEGTSMSAREHEALIMEKLDLKPVTIARQAYPRIYTFLTMAALATVGAASHKFARDVKAMQSPGFGEVSESRASGDRSSSAMMHKRNPRHSENVKALAKGTATKMLEAWLGAADETFERGLEDSAGKRSYLPEAFLAIDEILKRTEAIIRGLKVNQAAVRRNLDRVAPFIALEPILTELTKRGAHRQEMDDLLRTHVTVSLDEMEAGRDNPLGMLVYKDPAIGLYLNENELEILFASIYHHVGDAPERCTEFLQEELYPAIQG